MDDIEELFELLGAVGGVAAETEDYVDISTADDLRTLDEEGEINELLLRASDEERSAGVRLSRPTEVWISARDDYQLRGVLDAMRELLTKRELFFGAWNWTGTRSDALLNSVGALAAGVTGLLASGLLAFQAGESSTNGAAPTIPSVVLWGSVAVLTVLAATFAVWRTLRGVNPEPKTHIVLRRKAEAPTFWERNKTPILINVITGLLVGTLFFFLGLSVGD